ncbi:hypothetical protein BJY01DRAFT_228924 [Aspergillus pseudoustus]|uniref:F-box domain-containing protein n=1 Tax=Aspergillus pseudoustus TaxID=1810923 RepID=A0ABR4IJC3_9EURO
MALSTRSEDLQDGTSRPVLLEDMQQVAASFNLKASLENLPPEVRRQILSASCFDSLNALVHASPVYHQQYLLDRWHILCDSLKLTLGSVFVDAYTAFKCGQVDFLKTRSSESVTRILEGFAERRLFEPVGSSRPLAIDEIVGMLSFHRSIIIPVARRYTTWALDNLLKESASPQTSHEPLSRSEETRVFRALYRLQLFCNLFGENHHEPLFHPRLTFGWGEVLEVFIFLFEPWEVEELHCVYTFAKATYDRIFDKIAWDVDEKNPKFDGQRPPTPDGAFDLSSSRISFLEGTTSCGLHLLHTVLFRMKDHNHLVQTMQNNISLGNYQLEEYILRESTQYWQRDERLSERDVQQERRDPLPFRGDRVPDPDSAAADLYPPLAWTILWKGTYSNLYAYYFQEELKEWGYVMWDASRLASTGAEEVLRRQWAVYWEEDEDPRDEGMLL